jgi:hypothetical protein
VVYEEVIKRMNESFITSQLDHFDDLFTGNPVDIERNLSELLPEAEKRADKSVYLQILSQKLNGINANTMLEFIYNRVAFSAKQNPTSSLILVEKFVMDKDAAKKKLWRFLLHKKWLQLLKWKRNVPNLDSKKIIKPVFESRKFLLLKSTKIGNKILLVKLDGFWL